MATNQYGQTYSGNDDFRGWLAAGNRAPYVFGSGIDQNEWRAKNSQLLNHVGNDGGTGDSQFADIARYNYNYWNSQRQSSAANNQSDYGATSNTTKRTSGGSGSTTTSSAQAAKDAKMRSFYDNRINSINDTIDKLGGGLQNQLDRINGEYNTYKNEQESAYKKAKGEYDNSSKQNTQSLVANRNTITDNASHGLRGLQRVLGAMGAGGSSVARYNAPDAVKAQADQENANAGLTYSQNQQNLDTDWGNYQNDYENDKKKLEDWKNGQIAKEKQAVEERRVSLLEQLAEAIGNRSQYGGDTNALGDVTNRIKSANSAIQEYGKYQQPNYNGISANYEAKPLSTYDTGQTDLSTQVESMGDTGSTNLLSVLRSLTKKKQTNPYLYGQEED